MGIDSRLHADLAFVQRALQLRTQRQAVLAANLANADTPNYKARDIDFAAALRSALAADALPLARTSARHLPGSALGQPAGRLLYRSVVQPSLDGNTVDPHIERAQFADNALHVQFLLERAMGTLRSAKLALEPAK
ncbi:MAG: flagellar basal body rod protein FlgB [Thiobacillaceae bacterium]|nr:flagellar basal body rod protein FlgB [Thiobacillaceae bacterium]